MYCVQQGRGLWLPECLRGSDVRIPMFPFQKVSLISSTHRRSKLFYGQVNRQLSIKAVCLRAGNRICIPLLARRQNQIAVLTTRECLRREQWRCSVRRSLE